MSTVLIVAIVFGSLITFAALLCGTVVYILRMRHGGVSSSGKKASRDEAMMIQEIYRGLEKMEKRIEALETILMDTEENSGEKK